MDEWTCLQPPKPPPTYDHFIQAAAYPARCLPGAEAAPQPPERAPGFVCVAEDRFPPHPYAPRVPVPACHERLPITRPPPDLRAPLAAVPNYYPQPTLRAGPPPCCAENQLAGRCACAPAAAAALEPLQRGRVRFPDAPAPPACPDAAPGAQCAPLPAPVSPPPPPQPLNASMVCDGTGRPIVLMACEPRDPCLPMHPDEVPPDPALLQYMPLCCPPRGAQQPPAQPRPPRPPPDCRAAPMALPPTCQHLVSEEACPRPEPAMIAGVQPAALAMPEPPPCYLPQPHDLVAGGGGPGGDGMLRLRPVVDKYSLTRYAECDWRKHNDDVLRRSAQVHDAANCIDFSARRCAEACAARADEAQSQATRALCDRDQEIQHWKCRLERALVAIAEEVNQLQIQRHRLKTSMGILRLPEAIAEECLSVRATRLDCDLVRDEAEEELIKEASLMQECRTLMERYLKQIEDQIESNMNIKAKCEFDWSDKKVVHEIESMNIVLKNNTPHILFRPGATRIPENQSSLQKWDMNTRESINILEAELERSVELRGHMDALLKDMIRDMRAQADKVETQLEASVAALDECRVRLEGDLRQILQRIADTEKLIKDLKQAIRNHDMPMKKVQTRLCNRQMRPRAENCKDPAQDIMLQEIGVLNENVSAQKSMLDQAEENLRCLIHTRGVLEREVQAKRHTLFVTRDRIRAVRAHYPSAAALTGY